MKRWWNLVLAGTLLMLGAANVALAEDAAGSAAADNRHKQDAVCTK